MKILLDQGVPVPLNRYLVGHSVDTAHKQGYNQFKNIVLNMV